MDVGATIPQVPTATHFLPHTTSPPSSSHLRKTHYSFLIFTLPPSHFIPSLQSLQSSQSFQAFQALQDISLDATTFHHQKEAQIHASCVHS